MPIDKFGRMSFSDKEQKQSTLYLDKSKFLKHDGSISATAPFDMGGNPIKNLSFPAEQNDAANREYVDNKINNLDTELKAYINEVITEKVREIVSQMLDAR